ncbi:MAG: hypothetical protein QME64_03295 [bacterium]|nr:hypothetical protein [bacterium]
MVVENTEVIEFEINDKVEHPKWGLGVVMHQSGSGEKAKVMVQFYQEDKLKTLMVKYAKLKKVGTAAPPPKRYVKPIIEDIKEKVHPEVDPLHPAEPGAALKEKKEENDKEDKEE